MTQRNYGCDGQIRLYFGVNTTVDLDAVGEAAFKGQLYQCQLVQAFVLKQVYEARRAANQLGHLVWMLNEICTYASQQSESESVFAAGLFSDRRLAWLFVPNNVATQFVLYKQGRPWAGALSSTARRLGILQDRFKAGAGTSTYSDLQGILMSMCFCTSPCNCSLLVMRFEANRTENHFGLRGSRKPVHYAYKRSLMTDVMATCGTQAFNRHTNPPTPGGQPLCYLSNHRAGRAFSGTVTLTAYDHFGDGEGRTFLERKISLPEGPGTIEWFGLAEGQTLPAGNATALMSTVVDEVGAVVSEHMVQLVTPEHICVPPATISLKIAGAANADGTIDIVVTSDKVALWVTMTTLAQGRFSDNAFFLPAATKTVQFVPFSASTAAEDLATLKASLRAEDYSMYRSLACGGGGGP